MLHILHILPLRLLYIYTAESVEGLEWEEANLRVQVCAVQSDSRRGECGDDACSTDIHLEGSWVYGQYNNHVALGNVLHNFWEATNYSQHYILDV